MCKSKSLMKYVLESRYRLRGWYKLPTGLYDSEEHAARFFLRNYISFWKRRNIWQNQKYFSLVSKRR